MFDRKVLQTNAGEVVFETDQLVQVYDNSLDITLSTTRKLLPRWSAPRCIVQRAGNSYTLKTLEGFPVPGWVHARCLREFIPRSGTALAADEDDREMDRERRGSIPGGDEEDTGDEGSDEAASEEE